MENMWFYGSSKLDEKVDGYLVMQWIGPCEKLHNRGYYVVVDSDHPGYDIFYAQPTIKDFNWIMEFAEKYNLAVAVIGGPLAIVTGEEVYNND